MQRASAAGYSVHLHQLHAYGPARRGVSWQPLSARFLFPTDCRRLGDRLQQEQCFFAPRERLGGRCLPCHQQSFSRGPRYSILDPCHRQCSYSLSLARCHQCCCRSRRRAGNPKRRTRGAFGSCIYLAGGARGLGNRQRGAAVSREAASRAARRQRVGGTAALARGGHARGRRRCSRASRASLAPASTDRELPRPRRVVQPRPFPKKRRGRGARILKWRPACSSRSASVRAFRDGARQQLDKDARAPLSLTPGCRRGSCRLGCLQREPKTRRMSRASGGCES